MKGIKRVGSLIAVMAAVAAVALAVPALAAARTYTGSFTNGGTVSFKSVARDGKIVRVSDFAWKNVPITCLQGKSTYSGKLPFSIGVAGGLFSINAPSIGLIQVVNGKFTNASKNAKGLLNVYGDINATHTACHTGKLAWTAAR